MHPSPGPFPRSQAAGAQARCNAQGWGRARARRVPYTAHSARDTEGNTSGETNRAVVVAFLS